MANELIPGMENLPADLRAQLAGYMSTDASADTVGATPSFPRIEMLHQNAQAFKIGGDSEDAKIVKSIEGIVIHSQLNKVWWEKDINDPTRTDEDKRPQCFSFDGEKPNKESTKPQAETCTECKHNKFGSHGRGKSCKDTRRLFVLLLGEPFPSTLTIPATSLKNWTDYVVGVFNKMKLRPRLVVTKIAAVAGESKDGIAFTRAAFSMVRPASIEEVALAFKLAPSVESYATPADATEYAPGNSSEQPPF